MKFDELDARMRVFETNHDHCVLPDVYMAARIDGRGFTKLTKERHAFDAPFDERFRDHMLATVEHLMRSGFRVVYGYTQSDEISLLFHRDEDSFGRKTRKFNSVLAGEASARFSLLLGDVAAFDCRVCELPTINHVRDYFRWRHEDAHRNALNAHCYWMLRRSGAAAGAATARLVGMSTAEKNELLFQGGVNFNDLPRWQKRGVGLSWESYEKQGTDPTTGRTGASTRRRIRRDLELPMGDDYGTYVLDLVARSEAAG
jgi:tRNA(His) 5'-end guanylyltransferase